MMLSVMVMGAGAAFTDQDKIVNEEAVDMISALGIVDGYEDDSFQPEKNIERGEAAKMIAVMLNGGKDAIQDATGSSFNDVLGSADAWANKYIEYGVAEGILAGVGGDRFAPASNVTGTQLAKMLLVSLGYDADKEGYLDDTSWAVNVNTDAASVGLYKGLESIDMNAALTRDNAAQMIWNALQANTVRYSILGGLTENRTTLLQDAFGDDYGLYNGVMVQVYYNQDKAEYTYSIADINVDRDGWWNGVFAGENPLDGADTFVSTADYSDLFAMNVTVLRNGDEALLIRINEGGTVVEGVIGDIDGNNDNDNYFTVNGQKYRLDNVAEDFSELYIPYNGLDDILRNLGANDVEVLDQYSFRAIDLDGGNDVDLIVYYPYVVLKSDVTLDDSFQINVIERNDASMVVDNDNRNWAQDRDLMEDLGITFTNITANNATGSAVIEYEDVTVNGTVAEEGYVMAVPAEYTATGIDTYTVLDIQSGVASSLNSADRMVTLGGTEYDGNLLDTVVPFESISLGDTYAYVEVNGYLFIVDGNNIGPVLSEYVVVTKTALAPQGVDKTWETNILKTDGTTETVDVYVSLKDQHYGPEVGSLYTYRVDLNGDYELIAVPGGTRTPSSEVTNFDIQQAYKDGATLNKDIEIVDYEPGYFTYTDAEDAYVANPSADKYNLKITLTEELVGTAEYIISVDDNNTPDLPSDDTYTATPATVPGSGNFIIGREGQTSAKGDYYYYVESTWHDAKITWDNNVGLSDMYGTNTAGGYFENMDNANVTYNIEDDAVIFVYNYNLNEYSVVKGSDLENVDAADINWAFTGATSKVANGTPTVDLGYVSVGDDPAETLVYAYVNGNAIRTTADGYVVTVNAILENGEEVTLSTKAYSLENDKELLWFYNHLQEGDIHQLIVDGSTLVGVKDEDVSDSATVAAKLDNLGIIKLTINGATANYYVDSDTVFIPVDGGVSSIADIVKGAQIEVVLDGNDILAVIY